MFFAYINTCIYEFRYACILKKTPVSQNDYDIIILKKAKKKNKLWLLLGENDRKLGKPLSSTIILILKATPTRYARLQ